MSADITTDTTTAPNSGVSLEVGATYRRPNAIEPEVGWTVLAIGERRFFARSSLGDESSFPIASLNEWVRVEPTPADRWLVICDQTDVVTAFALEVNALNAADNWTSASDKFSYRVARFTFAEWIDTDEATDG